MLKQNKYYVVDIRDGSAGIVLGEYPTKRKALRGAETIAKMCRINVDYAICKKIKTITI
jgi:hypothetical protein